MEDYFKNKEIIDVETGGLKVSSKPIILRALSLGSCVAVVGYDRLKRIGGIAHAMLPGRAGEKKLTKTKYARDAIDVLITSMQRSGSKKEDIEVSFFGGADMLGESALSEEIIKSISDYLKTRNIVPKMIRTGGKNYRSVSLDLKSGKMSYREGDAIAEIF